MPSATVYGIDPTACFTKRHLALKTVRIWILKDPFRLERWFISMPNSFLANLDWNSSGELARSDFEQVLSALLKMSELTTEDVSKTERHTT